MSEPRVAGALVCGFADQAGELAGLGWSLGSSSGGLLARDGEINSAKAELTESDEGVRLRLESDGAACEAELRARGGKVPLQDANRAPAAGTPVIAVCDAAVTVEGAGDRSSGDSGHLTRWRTSPVEGAELFRHLAIPAPDGGLLVVAARRDSPDDAHADESVIAALVDSEGRTSAFAEALLSTQYDDSSRQTRAGLELWPTEPDAPAMRAAGTLLGVAQGDGVTIGLMRSSAEGIQGFGSYLIWRS